MGDSKKSEKPPRSDDRSAAESLVPDLSSPQRAVRDRAFDELSRLQPDIPVASLEAALPDIDFLTARRVRILLRKIGWTPRDQAEDDLFRKLGDQYYAGPGPEAVGSEAVPVLLKILEHPSETEQARKFAASLLGLIGGADVIPALLEVFHDTAPGVWPAAARSLLRLEWKAETSTDLILLAAAQEDLSILPPELPGIDSSVPANLLPAIVHDGRVDFLGRFVGTLQHLGWSPHAPLEHVLCSVLRQTCPTPGDLGPFAVELLQTLLFKLDSPEHEGLARVLGQALASILREHGEALTVRQLYELWNSPNPYTLHEEIGFEEKIPLTMLHGTRELAKQELIRRELIDEKGNPKAG